MAVSAYAGIIIVVYCMPSSGSGTQYYDSRWLCDCSSFYKAFKGNDGAVFSNHTSIIPSSICSTIYDFHSSSRINHQMFLALQIICRTFAPSLAKQ